MDTTVFSYSSIGHLSAVLDAMFNEKLKAYELDCRYEGSTLAGDFFVQGWSTGTADLTVRQFLEMTYEQHPQLVSTAVIYKGNSTVTVTLDLYLAIILDHYMLQSKD